MQTPGRRSYLLTGLLPALHLLNHERLIVEVPTSIIMTAPLYTPDSCKVAYQLRWSLALFPNTPLPSPEGWLEKLRAATEAEGVRILEYHASSKGMPLFLLSTTPKIAPPDIVRSVKGRLQYFLRPIEETSFRRNFRLTSVGDGAAGNVERYVAGQLDHHCLADPRTTKALSEFQLSFPEVDLCRPLNSAHGQYLLALHIVLVHAERWRTAEPSFLRRTLSMVLSSAKSKGHQVSRIALLPDHLHFTVRVGYTLSPEAIALSYLNNTAYAHDMLRLWMDGYYVGTIGPYDMKAIRGGLEC